MTKYSDVMERAAAVEILMLLKEDFSYRELSPAFGVPVPVLSRYVNGHALPELSRARRIVEVFEKKFVRELLMNRIRFEERIFDHTRVLSDPKLLDRVGKVAAAEFRDKEIHKVLTVEVDGIPVASQVAEELGISMVVAKSAKEMGVRAFVEVKRYYSSGAYSYLFVPKGAIKRGERVLAVDDVVRTGTTLDALSKLCENCGARIAGVFTLLGFRDTLSRLRSSYKVPIFALLEL